MPVYKDKDEKVSEYVDSDEEEESILADLDKRSQLTSAPGIDDDLLDEEDAKVLLPMSLGLGSAEESMELLRRSRMRSSSSSASFLRQALAKAGAMSPSASTGSPKAEPPIGEGKEFQRILLRKGYLEKVGGKIKSWKLRFFMLYAKPAEFAYYEDNSIVKSSSGGTDGISVRTKSVDRTPPVATKGMKSRISSGSAAFLDEDKPESALSIAYLKDFYDQMVRPKECPAGYLRLVPIDSKTTVTSVDHFSFEVSTKDRAFRLKATSSDDKNSWMEAFKFVISGKTPKLVQHIRSQENLVNSLCSIVTINKDHPGDLVSLLTKKDEEFISSKFGLLEKMSDVFQKHYGSMNDLKTVLLESAKSVKALELSVRAVIIRAQLHQKITRFSDLMELGRLLLQDDYIEKNPALYLKKANELWNLAEEVAREVLGDVKFSRYLISVTREECRYIEDRDLFETHFRVAKETFKGWVENAKKSFSPKP